MRVKAYHANDGDCLLLTTETPDPEGPPAEHHVLVDGGRTGSFRANVRDDLYALDHLDVVCVSHIDDDHISGVVTMIEDEVDRRVFEFENPDAGPGVGPPKPPRIGEVWHNSLFDLVGDDIEPEVQSVMATAAGLLLGSSDPALSTVGDDLDRLATGERSAMELSRRISDRQLDIRRNRPRDEPMLRASSRSYRRVGPMTMRILGPTKDDLERLRTEWRKWIDDSRVTLIRLQEELLEDEDRLGTLAASVVASPLLASSLGDGASGVSAPNVASLMLLVEEKDGPSVLLTGDGVSSDILAGLDHYGKLDGGTIHVDVLKVQHHGALANVTEDFVSAVTADTYLFCGCGADENPELEVVEAFARARFTGIGGSGPVGPPGPFRFGFTSSRSSVGVKSDRQEHMGAVELLVNEVQGDLDPAGRFTFEFLDNGHLEFRV